MDSNVKTIVDAFNAIKQDANVNARLNEVKDAEEIYEILKASLNGMNLEDFKKSLKPALEQLEDSESELSDGDLEVVAGGGIFNSTFKYLQKVVEATLEYIDENV